MTAYSTHRLINESLEEGVVSVLSKPLDLNLILSFFSFLRKERSIVVIDDNYDFCQMIGEVLRERDFSVTEITDPHNMEITKDVNIVLLDMKLNNTDGLEVLKDIKEKYPSMPVVLVTAYGEEMASKIKQALEVSAHTCLYKPFQLQELLKVIGEIRNKKLRDFVKKNKIS